MERAEFPWLVRVRRRAQGRTQDEVARSVGITKGALSRYESGETGVVGDGTLRKLCGVLGIDVPAWLAEGAGGEGFEAVSGRRVRFHCPTPFCRMNPGFAVPGWVHFEPRFVESVEGAEVVCQYCGATMQCVCSHCGAALGEHGVCPACGEDYVPRVSADVARGVLELSAAAGRAAAMAGAGGGLPYWAPLRRKGVAGDAAEGGAGRSEPDGGASSGA